MINEFAYPYIQCWKYSNILNGFFLDQLLTFIYSL